MGFTLRLEVKTPAKETENGHTIEVKENLWPHTEGSIYGTQKTKGTWSLGRGSDVRPAPQCVLPECLLTVPPKKRHSS